ncbi:dihydroorotate dehydrogenase electron transfer subunit [Cytobacillus sp. S13-E01]|uniref:dihydroorotate dehydrogenase electron transfer subunit n=1 Tax=Cytobacillus sp. S13-E01 TaxID=3031326 RepID=UPI0023D834FD|nr:dihydroorotate dehydrogenase electron transfer subunit [Cytobacillus sp. S13-E01]MDF0725249.1 dihydroorotate dehydrogenase electron transfer subunit [Cytobacillus sp. S13-E01]
MIKKELMKVVKQETIAENIYEMTLEGNLVSEMNQPGQFVHVKVTGGSEPLLRRPISIANIDHQHNQFTMIYRREGHGTRVLSEKEAGIQVDVLGPLGNGFPVEATDKGETAMLVGGGIGVPPLYELSQQLVAKGVNVIHVLGFQTESAVFYEEQFSLLGETYIATVDGSYGSKGFITDVITNFGLQFDTLYSCGPTMMLKALEQRYADKRAYISLEERMGCGVGACFACVCHLQNDPNGFTYKKVCSDGPVFKVGEVVI